MTDDGHAGRFGSLYIRCLGISSPMARIYRAVWRAGPDFMRDLLPKPHYAAVAAVSKPDHVRMGVLRRMGC